MLRLRRRLQAAAPDSSAVAAAAARLGRNLLDQFGPATADTLGRRLDADALASLHAVIQLLPDIVAHLDHATWAWSAQRTLLAPEHRQLSFEGCDDLPIGGDGIERAEREDLDRLRHALMLSGSLTTALASDLRTAAAHSDAATRLPRLSDAQARGDERVPVPLHPRAVRLRLPAAGAWGLSR
jgi:hypothetical protein